MPNKRSMEYFYQAMEEVRSIDALSANAVCYAPRFMANLSLPARKQLSNEFIRSNGNQKICILSPSDIGLPYGTYPRKLIIHLTTIAKVTKERDIFLGDSITAFLRDMGIRSTGGDTGTLVSMRNQTQRLFSSSITCTKQTDSSVDIANMNIVSEAAFVWMPHAEGVWESNLKLSLDFCEEVQKHAIPIDRQVIEACSYHPLAMDIYCWLTYRYFSLSTRKMVPWKRLENQFGNVYADSRHFKRSFVKAITKISQFYPAANYCCVDAGLELYPSETHVSRVFGKTTYH